MFKKNTISSKSGRTYTILTLKKDENNVKIFKVSTESGESRICYSLDISSGIFKKSQIDEFTLCPNIMESMHHPNILKIYDKILTDKELHIIVSDFDMTLEELLLKSKIANPEQYFKLLCGTFLNVYELIKKFKFKRNVINLQNIFIRNFDVIFGGWDMGSIGQAVFESGLGQLYYRPPEYFKGKETDIEKADIWSTGVVLYSIYFGNIPFKGIEKDDIVHEIDNWSKMSNNLHNINTPQNKIIYSMLEANTEVRIDFTMLKDLFLLIEPSSKVSLKKKTAYKKLHNLNTTEENSKSIINEITDLNLKKKIETNLSTSMEMPDGDSYLLPHSHNSLSMLSLSQSSGATSYILTSEDEITDELLRYLFEKNKIIFIMDGFKQIDVCLMISQLQSIKNTLLYLGLLLVKRAYVENYYIFRLMESNFNIFNLTSYHKIEKTNAFSDLKNFFKEFLAYVKEVFHKNLPKYTGNDPSKKKQVEAFDKLTPQEINSEISKLVSIVIQHYHSVKGQLNAEEKKEITKSCMFWYLLHQNFHTFEKFPKTDDWIDFCQEIEEKTSEELEKILLKNK